MPVIYSGRDEADKGKRCYGDNLQTNAGRRNHILWKQGSERSGQVQRTESGN